MCACLRDKALLASKHLQEQGFSTIKLRHLGVTACIVHCYSIVEPFSFDILLAFAIFGFGLTWKKFEAEQSAIFSNKSLPFKPAKFIQSNLKKDHCKKETKFQSLFFLFSPLSLSPLPFVIAVQMLEFFSLYDVVSRTRSKGSRFTLGVWGLRVCSLDVAQPSATARNWRGASGELLYTNTLRL